MLGCRRGLLTHSGLPAPVSPLTDAAKYGLTPNAVAQLSPLDHASAASGLMLRDLHCALLRPLDARVGGLFVGGAQPAAAHLDGGDNEASVVGPSLPYCRCCLPPTPACSLS